MMRSRFSFTQKIWQRRTSLVCIVICASLALFGETGFSTQKIAKKSSFERNWYLGLDLSATKREGYPHSLALGSVVGSNLSESISAYLRLESIPETKEILDPRFGLSKSQAWTHLLRSDLGANLSLPLSDYSRSVQQITQLTLSAGLEYTRSRFSLGISGYSVRSFYSGKPEVVELQGFGLKQNENRGLQKGKNRTRVRSKHATGTRPAFSSPAEPLPDALPLENSSALDESAFEGFIETYEESRFEHLEGAAFSLGYRIGSLWSVQMNGSLSRISYSGNTILWSSDLRLLQIAYHRSSHSIFVAYGRVKDAPSPAWPEEEAYSAGVNLFFH